MARQHNEYVPLKQVLPTSMNAKTARNYLRDQGKFKQHDGRWEFPRKTADRVESYLINHTR